MPIKAQFKLVSKISPKTVAGKERKPQEKAGEVLWLYEVAGIANGTKSGESDYGSWTALTGSFMARRLSDDARFRSGVCFLPDVALNSVTGEMTEGVSGLQLAFRIGIQQNAKEPDTKYEYVAEPLIEITEDDPALALLDQVATTGAVQIADQSGKKDAPKKDAAKTA